MKVDQLATTTPDHVRHFKTVRPLSCWTLIIRVFSQIWSFAIMLKHSLRFLVHSPSIPRLQFPSYRMASSLPKLPIFEAISKHDMSSTAIIDSGSNQAFTYGTLLRDVAAAKEHLSQAASGSPLRGERVAFLAENSYNYVGR
jgi:hypothetical protein